MDRTSSLSPNSGLRCNIACEDRCHSSQRRPILGPTNEDEVVASPAECFCSYKLLTGILADPRPRTWDDVADGD